MGAASAIGVAAKVDALCHCQVLRRVFVCVCVCACVCVESASALFVFIWFVINAGECVAECETLNRVCAVSLSVMGTWMHLNAKVNP